MLDNEHYVCAQDDILIMWRSPRRLGFACNLPLQGFVAPVAMRASGRAGTESGYLSVVRN